MTQDNRFHEYHQEHHLEHWNTIWNTTKLQRAAATIFNNYIVPDATDKPAPEMPQNYNILTDTTLLPVPYDTRKPSGCQICPGLTCKDLCIDTYFATEASCTFGFYGRLVRSVKIIFKFGTLKYYVNPESLDV